MTKSWSFAFLVLVTLISLSYPTASLHAQAPTPTPTPNPSSQPPASGASDTVAAIARLVLDTLQGQTTAGTDQLFEQSRQSARQLFDNAGTDVFFLDFGNPNLGLNEFGILVARDLLALTPLYVVGYLGLLIYGVWKERPIPNPLLYAGLVAGVMFFLAAFAVITQGVSEIGRAIALTLGGAGDALYPRATLLDTVLRVLVVIQKYGGLLATPTLLVAIAETLIVLVQLAYRGISMAILRLISLLLIPLSVLLEGGNPRTAGQVLSGFFEAWLDIVGKIALLLIVLAIAGADRYANLIWFVLPAGLLAVILSWKFFGLFFALMHGAIGRAWSNLAPAASSETGVSLPAAAEAARAREIDAARRRNLED